MNYFIKSNQRGYAPRGLGKLILALSLTAGSLARAHDPGLSVATAHRVGETLSIQLGMARSDAERLVALDANHDGRVTEAEFQAALPELQTVACQAFRVTASGRTLLPSRPVVKRDPRDGLQFQIPFQGAAIGKLSVQAALLDKLPRGHRQFFSLRDQDQKPLNEQMLDASRAIFTAELLENPPISSAPHSFRAFLALGIEHIATGYDHLLFLLGLLIVGGSLRAALQIITSFTLAHSITLALATLNIINIPPKIIEPLIAASIVFVGLQNILSPGVEKRWLLTFGFGLIHGCGFASALRDLGIGANGTSITVPLLSFNLGVELGQLAIAALVLPLIWKCRASPIFVQRLVPIGSGMIVLAGGYWLLERTVF
jgi:hydrogenase/urease accessory protein HupE